MAKERLFIKTPTFRGSYVYLAKPKASTNDQGQEKLSYGMLMPFPKKDKATVIFIKELTEILNKQYVASHGKLVPAIQQKHWPIKDGDKEENTQFHGHWLIRCASNFKPSVCDVNGQDLDGEVELYSGAWYRAKISPWGWQNPKSGKGVSLNLESAMKVKDDEKFGGGSDAKDDFAEDIEADGGSAAGDDDLDLDL